MTLARVVLFVARCVVARARCCLRQRRRARCRAAPPRAQAFYEFMMARRLDAAGDEAGALAALERAQQLDPESAEIVAELAAYYSRLSKPELAIANGERALKLDPANVEAHRVLALVYGAWAEGGGPPPPGYPMAGARLAAIEHLTAIQSSPLMATDPNLQMTLGRLQLRSGQRRRRGADPRAGRGAGALGRRALVVALRRERSRSASSMKPKRRWSAPRRSIRATSRSSASSTSGKASGTRPPTPTPKPSRPRAARPAAICSCAWPARSPTSKADRRRRAKS